jgi:hypothetical protein
MTNSRLPESLAVGQPSFRFGPGLLGAEKIMDSLQLQTRFPARTYRRLNVIAIAADSCRSCPD